MVFVVGVVIEDSNKRGWRTSSFIYHTNKRKPTNETNKKTTQQISRDLKSENKNAIFRDQKL